MIVKRRAGIVGIAVLIFLLVSAFVVAQPEQGSEATLVVSEGQATVTQKGAVPLVTRQSNVSLSAGQALAVRMGDTISLDTGAVGQLRLFDGSTVDLTGGASLEVTELTTTEKSYRVRLNLLAGRTVSRVVRALGVGDAFEIRTPSSTASVRGTVFTVEVIALDATYFSCDEGVVHIVLQDQSVDIHPGEEVNAVVGRPLIVQPQPGAEPTAVPTSVPQPTATAVPAAPPSDPTVIPTLAPTSGKTAGKTVLVAAVGITPIEEIVSKAPLIPPSPDDHSDDPSPGSTDEPEKDKPENTPNSPSQVPGKTPIDTPGNGNPPDAGGLPPGQGGTPPGQEDRPPNDNNGGGNDNNNGGGKKDK